MYPTGPDRSNNFETWPESTQRPKLEFSQIACGSRHTVAVSTDGNVLTWGNRYGNQLGHGDKEDRSHPTKVNQYRFTHTLVKGLWFQGRTWNWSIN